ncbi:ABC1 kinase family protein [Neobacillus vireti]|uniref:ABC transporter n=1 Tax=Neobacillus vireti LMG 21834 TaxID=1131730 RepID=A0AB94IJ71_9BACI|nr:AarF/UbiB family protein [Neobacillus vireti]ETI67067.1 ABC transporter [Neobacillus vireti LMG 21834]KLT19684.1 ABC transporter [Neobacillus vireti]
MRNKRKWLRMWRILSFAFSAFIRVYWYRILKKSQSEREKLWGKIGQEFRQTLFELEGLLIKVGQFLSIRADLLPASFINQIQDLVDQVPASPWEEISLELEREWGGPIEDILASIDAKAVASASIGEVYRGKLKDGTTVAVKVQRPEIRSIIQTDFRSLAIIIWFADHFAPVPKGFINFKLLYQELKTVIEREVDFMKEMEAVIHFRQRFQAFPKLHIPKVYPELCTSKVMVLEWVDAARITEVDFLERYSIDRVELSQRLFRLFIPQWVEAGVFHADPHAGNVMIKSDGTLVLLDFGMVGEISKKDAMNFQDLIQSIFAKNYSMAVKVLMDLGFFLPDANSKTIEPLLKEALSIDFNQLKEMDLFQVKRDVNEMIKSLPIQVPTRFVFLGRSFVTVEGMLHTINPNQEFLEIAKPAFIDWLKQGNQNKWKLLVKWVQAQPVFQIFHSITDLLKTPKRLLEQKERQHQSEFYFSIFENQKKQSFFLGVLGMAGGFFGLYMNDPLILQISAGIVGISVISYLICSARQKKWLKNFEKKL